MLHQGEHRAQGVVHIVRDAPRQVGHGVLPLRDQHALLERLRPPRVLEGDGGLGEELGDQVDLVAAERLRVDRRDLEDSQQPVSRRQRRAQDRPLRRRRIP